MAAPHEISRYPAIPTQQPRGVGIWARGRGRRARPPAPGHVPATPPDDGRRGQPLVPAARGRGPLLPRGRSRVFLFIAVGLDDPAAADGAERVGARPGGPRAARGGVLPAPNCKVPRAAAPGRGPPRRPRLGTAPPRSKQLQRVHAGLPRPPDPRAGPRQPRSPRRPRRVAPGGRARRTRAGARARRAAAVDAPRPGHEQGRAPAAARPHLAAPRVRAAARPPGSPRAPRARGSAEKRRRRAAAVEVWLVRHGETEANAGRITQGQQHGRLTRTGAAQAASLGARLRLEHAARPFDVVLCSDLLRCRQTCSLATRHWRPRPPAFFRTDEGLRERSVGVYRGRERTRRAQLQRLLLSAVFHSFRLIFGRAIIPRSVLEA